MVSSLTIALNYLKTENGKFQPGTYALIECRQFELSVRLAVHGPLELLLEDKSPEWIDVQFEERGALLSPTTPGVIRLAKILPQIFSPTFVEFFEAYRPCLEARFGHRKNWPATFRFARAIRNSISHGRGKYLHDRNDPPVRWHDLAYDGSSNGKTTVGGDLAGGDVIALLFELSDELDALACPI